ncbi:hypothetical protein VTL71DRAFT_13695 [Oculimacula yallundae]|uniref:Alpha/beta hydrolase fold-3 domain-containing protein n=1 Tax=Oculimacula yallundae TaxID=86028 RepID=A0ABR4CNM0_9HELO
MTSPPDYFTSSSSWEAYSLENNQPLPPKTQVATQSTSPSPVTIPPLDFSIPDARTQQTCSDTEWTLTHPLSSIGYVEHLGSISVRDGASISVRITHPAISRLAQSKRAVKEGEKPRLPVLFMSHGGGWVQGTHLSEEAWMGWHLCEKLDLVVVSVEYRLAPEHRFPVWIEDSWDVLEVLLGLKSPSTASETVAATENVFANLDVELDLKKLFLAGSSSGAGISAVLSQMCRDRGIAISGVILNVPVVCDYRHFPSSTPQPPFSYIQAIPTFSSSAMVMVWNTILPSPEEGTDPKASPLLGDLKGLPRHLVTIAGQDALRDEGVAYVEKLRESGVYVEGEVFSGVPHHFAMIEELEETGRWRTLLRETLGRWVRD